MDGLADGAAEGREAGVPWANELRGFVAGPAVQVRDVEGGIQFHLGGPPRPPAPAQLPSPGFVANRREELRELRRLAAGAESAGDGPDGAAPGAPALVVICGPGGVGKTTLALHWLHQIAPGYDGQLFVDLRGFSGERPLDSAEPLERFLRALGAAEEGLPAHVEERAALFRSMVAGRRVIILLDNAVSAAQVRPLLPGAGPALVVVTTRRRLTGLRADGARFLDLGPMAESGAVELLAHMIGPHRIGTDAERERARSLVALCGLLPLAVCATGARLAARRRWTLDRAVRELDDEKRRLSALRTREGDMSVQAAFNASYGALEPAQASAYRRLGVHPGGEFDVAAAAALLGTDRAEAADLLNDLADASLLVEERDDRHRFHDLVRLHARAMMERDNDDPRAALARLADHYLALAVAADVTLMPGRAHLGDRHPAERRRQAEGRHLFADRPAARAWLEQEQDNLVAVVRQAGEDGLHDAVWQLAQAMWPLFLQRKHSPFWTDVFRLGAEAARACGDARAQARMLYSAGTARLNARDIGGAREHYTEALALEQQAGHALGEASALEGLGIAELDAGDPAAAAGLFARARDVHERLGRPRGVALMTRHIGRAHAAMGRPEEAVRHLAEALAYFARSDEPYHEARTLTFLGAAHLAAGRPAEAAAALGRGLEITRENGAAHEEANALVQLARVAAHRRDVPAERRHLEAALAIYDRLRAPGADAVRERLAGLTP